MGRRERWKKRNILMALVLAPALLASIVFLAIGDPDPERQGSGGSGDVDKKNRQEAYAGGIAADERDGGGADPEDGPYGSGGAADDGGAALALEGADLAQAVFSATEAEDASLSPMEKIAFVAADGRAVMPVPAASAGAGTGLSSGEADQVSETAPGGGGQEQAPARVIQRTSPLPLDAAILGGEAGTTVWALFLPAEMSARARIVFSGYESVQMLPLEEEGRLAGARTGPVGEGGKKAMEADPAVLSGAGAARGADMTQTGGQVDLSQGDLVSGIANGSAWRVRMTAKDGSAWEDVLYIFSCTGTATMYLDTASGSMEAVDGDAAKQTAEDAGYLVCRADGSWDSGGACSVSGRGNSTWKMKKRPYNLRLARAQSILGMDACKKLCLIANAFDHTNLLDRISSQMALSLGMRDTPQGEFVNLYLNGRYNGLYYLSQRVRTGGSVHIKKLDKKILAANGRDSTLGLIRDTADDADDGTDMTDAGPGQAEAEEGASQTGASARDASLDGQDGSGLPAKIPLHQEGDRLKKWAYDWPNEPAENTGGYLLQVYVGYDGEDCWFSTVHRRFRIMSPSYPTVGEVEYLQAYMLAAERAIYSEDGIDPETGKGYGDYLDLDSWQDMYLLEEFFAEWDAERWSFFITKDRGDPLLYCGPMWDFDHAAGRMIYGDYPETAVSMLMMRDTRHGWMYRLLGHEAFEDSLHKRWMGRFSPLVHAYLDQTMEEEIGAIESAAYMNNIRRSNDVDFREDCAQLLSWLQRRASFLDDYAQNQDRYCRVEFCFSWGNLSHYVPRGQSLGYLPLPAYGEAQVPSQAEKNEIIGWQDEEGAPVGPDILIDRDRTLTPIYRP